MSEHSVANAKTHLSNLIDRALSGEGVVITRHGRPVVELRPIEAPAKPVSIASLDRLAAHRATMRRAREDAGTFVSRLRDEEER